MQANPKKMKLIANGIYIATLFLFVYSFIKQNISENGMMYKANQLTYIVKILKAD